MSSVVKITGLAEVQRMMREAPKQVAVLGLAKALHAGGHVIESAVAERTPERDEGARSGDAGHLIDALTLDVQVDTGAKGGVASVHFGNLSHIAGFVEKGHRLIGHRPNKKQIGNVVPHPFMRPAADASEDAAIGAFSDSLSKSVEEYFSK